MEILFVSLFGLLGVLSRFGLERLAGGSADSFPTATFVINMAGSFLAGLVYVLAERKGISPVVQLGLLVGFCGGFTTFSAYALQAVQMIERGRVGPALVYLLASPLIGAICAAIPVLVVRKFLPGT